MKFLPLMSAAAFAIAAPALAQTMPAQSQPGMPPAADPNATIPEAMTPPADTGMMPADPNVPKDPSAPVGSPRNPVVVGGNVTPPPPTPQDYPLCSRTVQDSCRNPGEAPRGKRRPTR